MKKKRYTGAAIFMAAAIAAAVPLGVNRSLSRLREDAAGEYYYDQTGYVIYEGIDQREAAANNLLTVAERYSEDNPQLQKLMDELEYRVQVSENTLEMDDETFARIAAANAALDQPARELAAALEELELSEKDKKYPAQLIAQMESEQDKIARSSYNDQAREFNEKLARMKPVAVGKPLAVFDSSGAEPGAAALDAAEEAVQDQAAEMPADMDDRIDAFADSVADRADAFAEDVENWTEDMVDTIMDSIFD